MFQRKGKNIWRDEHGVSAIAYALVAVLMTLSVASVMVPVQTPVAGTVYSLIE